MIKYYVYISATKVNMLYPKFPRPSLGVRLVQAIRKIAERRPRPVRPFVDLHRTGPGENLLRMGTGPLLVFPLHQGRRCLRRSRRRRTREQV